MSRKELETGDRIPPGPLDPETEKEIDECIKFVLYVPSGRRRVEEILREEERAEGSHSLTVGSKRKLYQALETRDAGMLKALASDPDEVTYEVVTKAGNSIKNRAIQAAPLLIDLVLTPGEERYSGRVIERSYQRKFNQERRFLVEILDTIPQGAVEEYLRSFIGQINFRNRMLACLTPARRYEILFSLFSRHLVYADSFQTIHDDLSREAYPLPIEYFPSREMLTAHYRIILYGLSQRWPEIAQKYSLGFDTTQGPFYAATIMRRMESDEQARHLLKEIEASRSFGEAIVQAARSFPPTSLLPTLRALTARGAESGTVKRILNILKLFAFSEGRSLDPELSKGKAEVFKEFMEVVERVKNHDYERLTEPINAMRVLSMHHLLRLLGQEGIESIIYKLPEMTVQERIELPEILRKKSVDELGTAEEMANSFVQEIGDTIVDLESNLKYPEILCIRRKGK